MRQPLFIVYIRMLKDATDTGPNKIKLPHPIPNNARICHTTDPGSWIKAGSRD